jgi:hypothetical protein
MGGAAKRAGLGVERVGHGATVAPGRGGVKRGWG